MKTLKINLFFIAILLLTFSCKKKKTPPELSLLGDAIMQLCLGDSLVDPGATSLDAYDVDITGTIDVTTNVDNGTVGSYTITYTSTDENGNVTTVERVVDVDVCVSSLLSSYTVSHDCQVDLGLTTIDIIADSQSIIEGAGTNDFIIEGFNAFIDSVSGTIDGSNVTIPSNNFSVGSAPLAIDVTLSGTGTVNDTGNEITIEYTYSSAVASGSCTAVYTK